MFKISEGEYGLDNILFEHGWELLLIFVLALTGYRILDWVINSIRRKINEDPSEYITPNYRLMRVIGTLTIGIATTTAILGEFGINIVQHLLYLGGFILLSAIYIRFQLWYDAL